MPPPLGTTELLWTDFGIAMADASLGAISESILKQFPFDFSPLILQIL